MFKPPSMGDVSHFSDSICDLAYLVGDFTDRSKDDLAELRVSLWRSEEPTLVVEDKNEEPANDEAGRGVNVLALELTEGR